MHIAGQASTMMSTVALVCVQKIYWPHWMIIRREGKVEDEMLLALSRLIYSAKETTVQSEGQWERRDVDRTPLFQLAGYAAPRCCVALSGIKIQFVYNTFVECFKLRHTRTGRGRNQADEEKLAREMRFAVRGTVSRFPAIAAFSGPYCRRPVTRDIQRESLTRATLTSLAHPHQHFFFVMQHTDCQWSVVATVSANQFSS